MRKLDQDDIHLLRLVAAAGGSVCPGNDVSIPKAAHKLLRRLALRGDLTTEETDDGVRFHLTEQGKTSAKI